MKHLFTFISIVVIATLTFWGCESSTDPADESQSNFELMQPILEQLLADGIGAPIKAQDLYDDQNDTDVTNDYFVLSVRTSDSYLLGHIPGAANAYWRDIAKDATLAMLPTDQKIAVYCYTGHTGTVATMILNSLGYEAYNLKFGIMSWTQDSTARVQFPFNEAIDAHNFATETQVNAAQTYELAEPNFVSSQDVNEVFKAAGDEYASNDAPVIKAQDLYDNLNDGNTANDPQIISVRAASAYAVGHIPGAINIPWKEIGTLENLAKVDPDRQVVVYCYTGHTGAAATTALKLLGYNAVNLKHGIMSWTQDGAVRVASPFQESVDAHNFPLNTGGNP